MQKTLATLGFIFLSSAPTFAFAEQEINLVSGHQIIEFQQRQSVDPIYIGGVRYNLSKQDFSPYYDTVVVGLGSDGEPIERYALAGYRTIIPVEGDFGQMLFFDVFGSANGNAQSLRISCGGFYGYESGRSYAISKQQITEGRCQSMSIDLSIRTWGTLSLPSSINLTVIISEQL